MEMPQTAKTNSTSEWSWTQQMQAAPVNGDVTDNSDKQCKRVELDTAEASSTSEWRCNRQQQQTAQASGVGQRTQASSMSE
eukprot:g6438.t1